MNEAWSVVVCCAMALLQSSPHGRAGSEQDQPPEVMTRDGIVVRWDWRNAEESKPKFAEGGYYLRSDRFLAAWNFNSAIRRQATEQKKGSPNVPIAVIDMGFGEHRELRYGRKPGVVDHANLFAQVQGTFIAGIIAADSTDGRGIQGCTPFAVIYPLTLGARISGDDTAERSKGPVDFTDLVKQLELACKQDPLPKVINIGLGYNLSSSAIDISNSEFRKQIREQVQQLEPLVDIAHDKGIIIVSAAGNDSSNGVVPAAWSSPLNYLALVGGIKKKEARTNIIVVESVNDRGGRSFFSNGYGNLAAPGELILGLSVVSRDHGTSDSGYSKSDSAYTVISGTLLAAAQVSALIAHIYAYNPKLTIDNVLNILDVRIANRPSRQVPAGTIDAFDAMLRCQERAFKDLADLNDDGHVDDRDFNLFRQAIKRAENESVPRPDPGKNRSAQAQASTRPPPVHPWFREDLNGDGVISRVKKAPLWHPVDKMYVSLTDLQVMMEAWEADASVHRSTLPQRIDRE